MWASSAGRTRYATLTSWERIDGGMHICRPTVTGFIRAPFSGMRNLHVSPTDCLVTAYLGRPCQLCLEDLQLILITAGRQHKSPPACPRPRSTLSILLDIAGPASTGFSNSFSRLLTRAGQSTLIQPASITVSTKRATGRISNRSIAMKLSWSWGIMSMALMVCFTGCIPGEAVAHSQVLPPLTAGKVSDGSSIL